MGRRWFRPGRAKSREGLRAPCRNPTRNGRDSLARRPPDPVSGARSRRGRESGSVRARLRTSAGTALENGGPNAGLAPYKSTNPFIRNDLQKVSGGEGGIRTHVPVSRQDAFEAPPLRPLRYLSAPLLYAGRAPSSARRPTTRVNRPARLPRAAGRRRTPAPGRGTRPRARRRPPRRGDSAPGAPGLP